MIMCIHNCLAKNWSFLFFFLNFP